MFKYTCPKCKHTATVPTIQSGKVAECDNCHRRLRIRLEEGAEGEETAAGRPAWWASPLIACAGGGLGLIMAGGIVLLWAVLGRGPAAVPGQQVALNAEQERKGAGVPAPAQGQPQPGDPDQAPKPDPDGKGGKAPGNDNKPPPPPPDDDEDELPNIAPPAALSGEKIYGRLLKSVVWIWGWDGQTFKGADGQTYKHAWTGSGALIDRDRMLVLTNEHVAPAEAVELKVLFPQYDAMGNVDANPTHYSFEAPSAIPAKLLAKPDKRRDMAIIQLESLPKTPAPLALPISSHSARPGQNVYAIGGKPKGNAGLWGSNTGVVRQIAPLEWTYDGVYLRSADVVQTTMPINPGDSGGALVDDRCALVGVNNMYKPSRVEVGENNVKIDETRLVSTHIDVMEVWDLLRRTVGQDWKGADPVIVEAPPEDLDKLARALNSKRPETRKRAAERLAALGAAARRVVPRLLERLRTPGEPAEVVAAIDNALEQIGPPDKKDLPALIDALQDQKCLQARRYAADALGKMSDAGKAAVDPLVKACQDEDTLVKRRAAVALGRFGVEFHDKAHAALLALLKNPDKEVRKAALEALWHMGKPSDPAPLRALLADQKAYPEERVYAVVALGSLGADEVPALLKAMAEDGDPWVVSVVAMILGELRVRTPEVGQALARAVDHKEKRVRLVAVRTIRRLGLDGPLVPAFLKALGSREDEVVLEALEGLPGISTFDKGSPTLALTPDSIELLKPALTSSQPAARCFAAYVLGNLGKDAAPAMPALRAALGQEQKKHPVLSPFVRLEMLSTVARVGPPALTALGQDADSFLDELKETTQDLTGADTTPPEAKVLVTLPGYGSYWNNWFSPPVAVMVVPGQPGARPQPRDRPREVTRLLPTAAAIALVRLAPEKPQGKEALLIVAKALRLRNPKDPDPFDREIHDRAKAALIKAGKAAIDPILKTYRANFLSEGFGKTETNETVWEKVQARKVTFEVLEKMGKDAKDVEVFRLINTALKTQGEAPFVKDAARAAQVAINAAK
jgi:HEAT repeat protein/S1-C subfamily serine protease